MSANRDRAETGLCDRILQLEDAVTGLQTRFTALEQRYAELAKVVPGSKTAQK